MLSEILQGVDPLFLRTLPGMPLTAELYEYSVVGGIRNLAMRYHISRDGLGSVYLGVCSHPAPFGEETPPLAVACIWDLPRKELRLRTPGAPEQVVGGPGSIFPAEAHIPVIPDRAASPACHLGYTVYGVEGRPGLQYCPSLEIAFAYTYHASPQTTREFLIQAVTPGEPSLSVYLLKG